MSTNFLSQINDEPRPASLEADASSSSLPQEHLEDYTTLKTLPSELGEESVDAPEAVLQTPRESPGQMKDVEEGDPQVMAQSEPTIIPDSVTKTGSGEETVAGSLSTKKSSASTGVGGGSEKPKPTRGKRPADIIITSPSSSHSPSPSPSRPLKRARLTELDTSLDADDVDLGPNDSQIATRSDLTALNPRRSSRKKQPISMQEEPTTTTRTTRSKASPKKPALSSRVIAPNNASSNAAVTAAPKLDNSASDLSSKLDPALASAGLPPTPVASSSRIDVGMAHHVPAPTPATTPITPSMLPNALSSNPYAYYLPGATPTTPNTPAYGYGNPYFFMVAPVPQSAIYNPWGAPASPRGPEIPRQVKAKRTKSHTVTSKSYSIPVVPRDRSGGPMLPLNVGIMTVLRLGAVCTRDHFHTERYIFPVGYEVTRRYLSTVDPANEVVYHCTILDGGDGPKFQIVPSDDKDRPVIAGTATGAWSSIVKQANAIRNRQHSNSVSGPDFFGLGQNTIKHLLQELPNADKLRDYVWQNFVEGGPLGGRHAAVIPVLPEDYNASTPIGAYYPSERDKLLGQAPNSATESSPRTSHYPAHIMQQYPRPQVITAPPPSVMVGPPDLPPVPPSA